MVKRVQDRKRGCGWRKPGGLYLVASGLSARCGKLPLELSVCPVCGSGIKPARGWTWVDGSALFDGVPCGAAPERCAACPIGKGLGRCGLLWIGGRHYKRPGDWTREANKQGVSRRIPALPRGFEVGKTWVLVAHRQALSLPCPTCEGLLPTLDEARVGDGACPECNGTGIVYRPGIFHAFLPEEVQYVVAGNETDEELARMEERGVTPVEVERVEDGLFEGTRNE